MSIAWHLVNCKINSLKKHPKNPRMISCQQVDHLQNSLDKFGLVEKPIVNLDLMIISGHQRITLLKKNKVKEIECWMPDRLLDEKETEELLLKMNRVHGDFDYEMLANAFEVPELLDWGFTVEELQLDEVEQIENDTEEDDGILEPVKDEDAITKLGNIYELNEHRLICGDSCNPDVITKVLDAIEIDMVYTDPPYGINVNISDGKLPGNGKTKRNKFNKILNDDSTQTAIDSFNFCRALNIPIMIWWGANYYAEALPPSSCWIVWDKDTGETTFPDAELAWCNDNSPVRIFKHTWNGMIKDSEQGQRRVHPTQKPIALAEWCFKKYGNDSKNIFDLFVGSGSTLLACQKMKKRFFGIELSPAYCDIIVDRWKKFMIKSNKEFTIKRNGELQ